MIPFTSFSSLKRRPKSADKIKIGGLGLGNVYSSPDVKAGSSLSYPDLLIPGCEGHLTSARYGEGTLQGSSLHRPGLDSGCAPGTRISSTVAEFFKVKEKGRYIEISAFQLFVRQ
ncbi:uncharacterized protein J5F26_000343 isoform 1-T6 [Ciconia maguari]